MSIAKPESTKDQELLSQGTYLVTGGISGGIAFEMTKYLITHYGAKNIILQGSAQRPSKYILYLIFFIFKLFIFKLFFSQSQAVLPSR